MFEAGTYTNRRDSLAKRVQSGVLLFIGNELEPMNYADNPYPFWQDRSFLYYWGLDEPGIAGLIDAESGEATLFGNDPTIEEVVWTGPQPSLASKAERIGASTSQPLASLAEKIRAIQDSGRRIHLLPLYRASSRIRAADWLGVAEPQIDSFVSRPFIEAVVDQRIIKSAEEILEIEKAVAITRAMHLEGMRVARPGVAEWQVAGAVEGMALRHGGRLSFPIICSRHGETLHNHHYDNTLAAGDIVVLDTGGVSPSGYAGDITRTLPIGGRFEQRQRSIYELVLDAEVESVKAVRPGVTYRDVHLGACRILATGLTDLGIMKGDPEEAVAAGAHALFMPHGLGHMMGLDVHDGEGLDEDYVGYGNEFPRSEQFGLSALRLGRTLQEGFVLTVEPGLYFIPALIDRWQAENLHDAFIDYGELDSWRDFGGVRIEDDVVVTADGNTVLGEPIPKSVDEVEALLSD
jgi:Xaa-Pro aminopeptidase